MTGKRKAMKELGDKLRNSHFYPMDNRGARKRLTQEAHVVRFEF